MADTYDVAVIGGGAAGLVASKVARGMGKRTVLIEKDKLGGDCTLYGCVPSKTLIRAAAAADDIRGHERFGLQMPGPVSVGIAPLMIHIQSVIQSIAAGHASEALESEGINVLFGSPGFRDPHRLELDGRVITAEKFILCTGSRPAIAPIDGLDQVDYLTTNTFWNLEQLPESLIIVGAGPIGVELAAALNRLGVRITLLEKEDMLPREDTRASSLLRSILEEQGITIYAPVEVMRCTQDNKGVAAVISDASGERTVHGHAILVVTGRQPNTEGLQLENAGVGYDRQGVKTDRHLRTTTKHIFAAGDLVPPYRFSHVAEYEAGIAAVNACAGLALLRTNYDKMIDWAIFTDPELARAGLTEQQARQRYGDSIHVYEWDYGRIDRAQTDSCMQGLARIICDRRDMILGIHILGRHGTEVMHELQLARMLGRPFSTIAKMVHAYPSYSDAIRQPAKRCRISRLKKSVPIKLLLALAGKWRL